MEFRCEWCGKPQPADDPPCENCGHGSFERAVVRRRDETEPSDPVWECAACGRHHERHAPPCSRCGHTTLTQAERDYGDLPGEEGTSYVDLASRRYLALAALGLVGVVVLALAATGVVSLPGLAGDGGQPTVTDVPGSAERYDNVSLAAAERGFVARVNVEREDSGVGTLSRDDDLAALAEYANRRAVKAAYGDGEQPSLRELQEQFSPGCTVRVYQSPESGTPLGLLEFSSGEGLGVALAESYLRRGWELSDQTSRVGVDVHVTPVGSVATTIAVC